MSALLSVLCLLLVGVLCVVGVFHDGYRDTLAERVGMSLVGGWCLATVAAELGDAPPADGMELMLHLGLASFALGMAWRTLVRRPAGAEGATDVWTR